MHLLFEILSHTTAFSSGLLIMAHSVLLCIDLVCGNEFDVFLDVEGGLNMLSKEMLVVCLSWLFRLFTC